MKREATDTLVDVLGIAIAPLEMEGALAHLGKALVEQRKGYVCLAGVHGIMEAQRSPAVRAAYADSQLNLPDGMPTVWVGRWQGHSAMQRVAGPDLMLEIMRDERFAHCRHFLYGGKEGVVEELQQELERRFPQVRIVGVYSPPFCDLSAVEEAQCIATIERLKPDIVWVGISTPRQERFMHRMSPRLHCTLMFGVGAAFDFHTGRIRDCADWVKRAGLQWLDRLIQNPRHLWWRYLRNNPAFLYRILLQLARTPRRSGDGDPHGSPVLRKMDSTL